MRLAEFFKAYARERGIGVAEQLQRELRKILNVQAPVRRTRSGRLVATTRAKPFAIPRRVSGKLRDSIKVIRTARGASLQIYAKYALPLEKSRRYFGWPHRFLAVGMANLSITGRHSYGGSG